MSNNTFGKTFSFTTWGESHGEAIGCIIDGIPSNLEISESFIQYFLNRRRPGQSKYTTQRKETDKVKILSGVFEGKTTGMPISLIIENIDTKSKDYSEIKNKFRPGHADYTYHMKYGNRDYRGGGRSSARETAMRVAAGAIAYKILNEKLSADLKIRGSVIQIGEIKAKNIDNWDDNIINNNPFFSADIDVVEKWENYIQDIRKQGLSVGAICEVRVSNVPVGLGDPVYNKLDTQLASAIMSINAVKAFEIGDGFNCVNNYGVKAADEMEIDENGNITFSSNNSGGILGGISSGQDIILRFAVKATSSILLPRKTIDIDGNNTEIVTKGRHDPCVGIRAVPVAEAMVANVLADSYLTGLIQKI